MSRGRLVLVAFAALSSLACSLDRAGQRSDASTPRPDAGTSGSIDAAVDAEHSFDAGMDAAIIDAGSDAGDRDAGVDGGAPDAGRPSCDEVYDGVDLYDLCEETESECEFYVRLDSDSCEDLCEGLGTDCVDSWDDSGDECPRSGSAVGCEFMHTDAVCRCTRP